MSRVRFWLAFLLLGALPLALPAAAAAPASPWRPVDSDLPPDPRLRDRTLPNGVRYLILPNTVPQDHVSLRLVVRVGALEEAEDERGLAHFVEHMAFRGTRDFPNGKMAEALQRLGVAFGPDSTAFTTFNHTIYHLELPNATPKALQLAFHALREYAAGVTFDPALIERERGVVLSEMETRDTPEARAGDANLALLWPDSREAHRKVIGEALAIRTLPQKWFRDFYQAWYRPERFGIIVVGAVDPEEVEALIRTEFGPLAAAGPARPEPADLLTRTAAAPTVRVFRDPKMIGFSLAFERALHEPRGRDTHARRVHDLHRTLAFAMFSQRLHRIATGPDAPFAGAGCSVTRGLPDWMIATVGANARITDWQRAATQLEQEQRRAVQYGFTPTELDHEKSELKSRYEEWVRSASTRASAGLAQELVGTLLDGTVFTTPSTAQHDLAAALEATTLADCLQAFREAWLGSAGTVFVATNPLFTATEQEVAAVLNASRAVAVARPADVPVAALAYTDFGPPGRLTRDDVLPDLDLRLAEFANRVKFNFKHTGFEADTVAVTVRVGDGKLSLLKTYPGLDLFAESAYPAGGLGRHSHAELNELMAGHPLQLTFRVATDACEFNCRCARRELPFLLSIVTAFITDPGFRPEGLTQAHAYYGSVLAALAESPGGPIASDAVRAMYDGDGRFGMPTFNEFSAFTLTQLQAWLEPQLKHGPIELSVVGDTTWDEARTAVASTLGAIPERQPVTDRVAAVPAVLAPPPPTVTGYGISSTFKQIALAWYWPVPAIANIGEERRCYLLAAILRERIRQALREDLGAAYAPTVDFTDVDGFPTLNYFRVYVELDPRYASRAMTTIGREATALATKGPSKDEFERAKIPYARAMMDDVRTNGYWGYTVLRDAQQRPQRIAAARDRAADVAAITRAEVAALAKRFLGPGHAYGFATVPAK